MYEEENYWKRAMSKRLSRRQALRSAALAGLGVAGAGIIGCSSNTTSPTATSGPATAATKAPAAGTTPGAAATTAPAAKKPAGKAIASLVSLGEENLDPHLLKGGAELPIRSNMFDGLLMLDLDAKIVPALATSYKQSPDGLTWEFALRKGVKFHNGDPFTAADVKYSVDRINRPELKNLRLSTWQRFFDNVEVKDESTVVFHLKAFWPAFLYEGIPVVPKAYLEKVGDEAFGKAPVGTGAYKFVKHVRGQSLQLEANGDHPFRFPSIQSITINIVPELATRVAQLQAGEVDIIQNISGSTIDQLKQGGYQIVSSPRASAFPYYFTDMVKEGNSPLKDKRVRQALNICVDRKALADKLYFGEAVPETTLFFQNTLGYDTTLKPYPYDVEAAKKLLADAGVPNGFDTEINTYITGTFPFTKELTEAMVGYFAKIGVKAKANNSEYGYYVPAFRDKKLNGLSGLAIPASSYYDGGILCELQLATTALYSHYSNKTLDDIFDKSQKETDPAKREELLRQVHHVLYEDYAMLVPLHANAVYALGKKMSDLKFIRGETYLTGLDTARLKA